MTRAEFAALARDYGKAEWAGTVQAQEAGYAALLAAYDRASEDAARLDWLEARLFEAYGVELDRTFGGYVASLTTDDGATTYVTAHGKKLRPAIDAVRDIWSVADGAARERAAQAAP